MPEPSDNPMAYISKKWKGVYDTLCKGETAIFDQMTNLFTLCVTIGHLLDKSKPAENKDGIFRWTNLHSETDVPVLTAVAWDFRERNMVVLSRNKEIMEICCDFAEAGMQYLHENLLEDYMENGQLDLPKKSNIEFDLAQEIEGLRQQQSVFE